MVMTVKFGCFPVRRLDFDANGRDAFERLSDFGIDQRLQLGFVNGRL
jgi:hypothetical protein